MRNTINFENLSCKYFNTKDGINTYLNDIRKYTKLTTEEEEALFKRYKNGDEKAKEELILRNQRFIYSLAKMYSKNENEVMDYVNEGNIGLMTAIDKYDPERGFKFMTYGVWYIRRAMNFYMMDTRNAVNKSNNLKLAKNIDKIKEKYFVTEGRMPTDDELMDELLKKNIDVKNYNELYDVTMASINESIEDDYTMEDNSEFSIRTASENEYEKTTETEYENETVNILIKALSPIEKKFIDLKFGLNGNTPMNNDDIADNYGMSIGEVNGIIDNALEKMRVYSYEAVSV